MHHVCTLFRYGLDERAVEQLPFRHVHLCRYVPILADHIFQQDILEQRVHFGMYIVGVSVGFLLEFPGTFLNGIHVLFQLGELPVSRLQFLLFVCQLPVDSGQLFLQTFHLCG